MKGQIRNGLSERTGPLGPVVRASKVMAVLLAAAAISLAAPPSVSTSSQHLGVPGTINYVEGQVTLNGQPITPGAAANIVAQPNEAIDTQAGYAEVLLTPGAFLRIGHNSEVVMQSLGLADIQMQVLRGSAMIEAADLVKGTVMDVNMDGATTQIEKRGLYDFDASQDAVRVLDGKAKVEEAAQEKSIGKNHEILLADNPKLKVQDFDKKAVESDPLYVWSSARSQAEAQENMKLASTIVVNGGWYGPGWYWDPFWAGYAFVPGAGLLYSPFGWGFYSPGVVYAAPIYRGYYVRPLHGWHGGTGWHAGAGWHGGTSAATHAYVGGGFHGGGFHGGGFHGGVRR